MEALQTLGVLLGPCGYSKSTRGHREEQMRKVFYSHGRSLRQRRTPLVPRLKAFQNVAGQCYLRCSGIWRLDGTTLEDCKRLENKYGRTMAAWKRPEDMPWGEWMRAVGKKLHDLWQKAHRMRLHERLLYPNHMWAGRAW